MLWTPSSVRPQDEDDDGHGGEEEEENEKGRRSKRSKKADDEDEADDDAGDNVKYELLLANKWDIDNGPDPTGWYVSPTPYIMATKNSPFLSGGSRRSLTACGTCSNICDSHTEAHYRIA